MNSQATNSSQLESLYVEGRLHVQNKRESKTYSVIADCLLDRKNNLKLKITGPFSQSIARFTLVEDQLLLALDQEKKIISRPAGPGSLKSLFSLQVDPRDFIDIFRGKSPKGWICDQNKTGKCLSADSLISFERLPDKEKVKANWILESKDFKLSFMPVTVQTKVEIKSSSFDIKIPDTYKKL